MYSWISEGQPLLEVFGVRFVRGGGQAPAGTVSVFDGKRGQIIYSGDKPSSRQVRLRSGDQLPLTGPYRAVSADGCVAFKLDLHDAASSAPTKILVDVYDKATRYNKVTKRLDGRGAEVTYALLSDAAEAIVEVKLLRQSARHAVCTKVVARTDLGEVVLFDHQDGVSVDTGTEEEPAGDVLLVPLARSVVAVRLKSSLTVEVNLVVDGDDDEKAVTESVVCVPELGSEVVQRRPAAGVAAVEIKVTWLD